MTLPEGHPYDFATRTIEVLADRDGLRVYAVNFEHRLWEWQSAFRDAWVLAESQEDAEEFIEHNVDRVMLMQKGLIEDCSEGYDEQDEDDED